MKTLTLGGAAAVLLVVVGLPLAWLVAGSVTGPSGATLEHYRVTFTNPDNYRVLLSARRRPGC